MAHVCLVGCEENWQAAGLQNRDQCAHLDRVAEGGARAVALGGRDVVGLEAGLHQRGPDAQLLGRPVGGRHAGAPAVLVHLVADGHGLLHLRVAVAVADGDVGHAAALTSRVAVAGHVEGEAAALHREHVLAGGADVDARIHDHVDAAGQRAHGFRVDGRCLGAALRGPLDGIHRGAEGRQPRGAGRVAGPAGASKVQVVGNPLARDGERLHRLPVRVPTLGGNVLAAHLPRQQVAPPLRAAVAQVDQDRLALEGIPRVACAVQSLVPDLEALGLRWRHDAGLVVPVAEERVVEAHDLQVVAEAAVVVVTVPKGDEVRVAILREVHVGVEARVRHIDVRIRAREVHAGGVLQAPAAAAREAGAGHDVGALASGDGRPARDAEDVGLVLARGRDVAQRDLGRGFHEPGHEGQVLA
mmetsp:Transcript_109631/g.309903  ORF Transcript_109631/g.309903 Transcript_109631/m.309903 type:complete len:414 (-) Transcript_109631:254-1495(-)